MTERLVLESEAAVVEVVPRLGGSIAAFDLKHDGERIPIFRRWTGEWENPRALGSSPMLPWFNRISGGGIDFAGKFHPIAPNDPLEEPVPLHGDGWLSPWEAVATTSSRITLRLRSRGIPPFDYEAAQIVALEGATLVLDLSLTHLGAEPFPYGLGQHPWFPRTPAVRLQARASGVYAEQPPAFPQGAPISLIPEKWNFEHPHPLPDDVIDNSFIGWDGKARIDWPDRGVAVDVEADEGVRCYQVYSLGLEQGVFCFEPVTHPNNAYALPGGPAANGLRILAQGETTSMRATFAASVL